MSNCDKTDQRKAASALFSVTFFFWFSQYAYASYVNPILERAGASATFMGLVGGVYGFTQLLLRIPLGIAADRLNRQKSFIAFACGVALVASLGMFLFPAPAGMFVFRALSGVSCSLWVCFTVLYSRYFPPEESAGRITRLNIGNSCGRLCSYALAAVLISLWDMRYAFLLGSAGAAAAVILCTGVKEVPSPNPPASFGAYLRVMKNRHLLVCSGLTALTQFVAFGTEYSFAANLHLAMGASAVDISYFNIALLIASIASNALVSKMILAGRSPKAIYCAGQGMLALYCLLMPAVTGLWMFYPLQMLVGVANSCTMAVMLGQCIREVPQESRSTAMGFFQAVYSLGLTFGPMAMGVLVEHFGYARSFRSMALIGALTVVPAFFLLNEKQRQDA